MNALVLAAVVVAPIRAGADGSDRAASIEVFNEGLSPYGEWVVVADVGRVWRPSVTIVGADFVPYSSGGHWVLTGEGWVFESDYPWGWGPFHYGRWFLSAGYGWVWEPDMTWGPSWVEWRHGGGFSGWAPLPPPQVLQYAAPWVFVETRHFAEPRVHQYLLPAQRVHDALLATVVLEPSPAAVGNVSWHHGPPAADVEQQVGHPIERVALPPPPRPGTVSMPGTARHEQVEPAHAAVPAVPAPAAPARQVRQPERTVAPQPAALAPRLERAPISPAPAKTMRPDRAAPSPTPTTRRQPERRDAPAAMNGPAPQQGQPAAAPKAPAQKRRTPEPANGAGPRRR
jgi:hypothetical protein